MHDFERFRLRFGPYRTPRFRYGRFVQCAVRGEVKIVGLSDAPIPWPIGQRGSSKALIVYGALVRAVKRESNQAVAKAWGVSSQTVTKWRKALGVSSTTEGTSALRSAHSCEPWAKRALRKAVAKARDPERREKIAAARRGKPRPAHVIEAVRKAHLGKRASAKTRRQMSESHKLRWAADPRKWSADEDALIARLPPSEAAKRTGRTVVAVRIRRSRLGLPDGRTRATRAARAQ